jgi:hypothetical protein
MANISQVLYKNTALNCTTGVRLCVCVCVCVCQPAKQKFVIIHICVRPVHDRLFMGNAVSLLQCLCLSVLLQYKCKLKPTYCVHSCRGTNFPGFAPSISPSPCSLLPPEYLPTFPCCHVAIVFMQMLIAKPL